MIGFSYRLRPEMAMEGRFFTRIARRKDITVELILNSIGRSLQSASVKFFLNKTIDVRVTVMKSAGNFLIGKGRPWKERRISRAMARLEAKLSTITVPNVRKQSTCIIECILLHKALYDNDKRFNQIRRKKTPHIKRLQDEARAVARECGLSPFKGLTFDDIDHLMTVKFAEFKLNVYCKRTLIRRRPPTNPTLGYDQCPEKFTVNVDISEAIDHACLCHNLKGYLGFKYLCHWCSTGYNVQYSHTCSR